MTQMLTTRYPEHNLSRFFLNKLSTETLICISRLQLTNFRYREGLTARSSSVSDEKQLGEPMVVNAVIPLLVSSGLAEKPPAQMSLANSITIEKGDIVVLVKLKPQWKLVFPLFRFSDFHFLFSTEMGPFKIPPEHVYCVQAGKKHYELFTTTYVGANYCGRCGLANPFRPQHRARSKTPALPGPYDEVVEVEDSPPPRPASPASQLLRDRPKPVSSIGVGRTAQQLPIEAVATGAMTTRARIPPPELSGSPQFMTVASAASRAIQNSKANTRKPTRYRTGYQWVHISLLVVSLESKYFNGLAVEVPETVLPLKDTVLKFSSVDLLTWPSFTAILFDHLHPLPPTIDLTNRDLWTLSYASSFSGKKIVTVPNTDKYTTPSSMLASGHLR